MTIRTTSQGLTVYEGVSATAATQDGVATPDSIDAAIARSAAAVDGVEQAATDLQALYGDAQAIDAAKAAAEDAAADAQAAAQQAIVNIASQAGDLDIDAAIASLVPFGQPTPGRFAYRGADNVLRWTDSDVVIDGLVSSNLGIYSAKTLGIVESAANNGPALLAALQAVDAAGGGQLVFPRGVYKITTAVSVALVNDIELLFSPGAVIDGRTSTVPILLTLGGSVRETAPLTADVAAGADLLSTSAALAVGDVVLLHSSDLFDDSRTYYYKGEFVRVTSTAGRLAQPLYDSYAAATTQAKVLNAPQVTVRNMTLLRNSNHDGMQIQYARDVQVSGSYIRGTRGAGMVIYWCLGGVLEENNIADVYGDVGRSYGIAVASCQDLTLRENKIFGGRHGVTTGGQEPCRNLRILDNTISSFPDSGHPAINTHENGEYITIAGNTVDRGIHAVGARNVRIENNEIRSGATMATVLCTPRGNCRYMIVRGNSLQNNSSAPAIRVEPAKAGIVIDLLEVAENVGTSTALGIYVQPSAGVAATIRRLVLDNNTMRATTQAVSIAGTLTVELLEISRGYYRSSGGATVVNVPCLLTKHAKVHNVSVETAAAATQPLFIFNDASTASISIEGGYTRSDVAAGKYSSVQTTGDVTVAGMTFVSMDRGLIVFGAASLLWRDNRHVGASNSNPAHTAGRILSHINAAGKVAAVGTAAPTAGTWARGDRVENTTPAAGGFTGWVCTAAGTPGIWKGYGAIDA